MGQILLLILSLVGGIALFLYGLRVMSQGVLKLSGSRIRSSLRDIKPQFLPCFGLGTWMTALIQSSSAATLMTVGLVNAGMITVAQSIAVIMGANVGTTVTAWYLALFGYAFPIGIYAIPLVVAALPFTYSSKITRKPWGEILMGAAIMILGFTTFIGMVPQADPQSGLLAFTDTLDSWGYGGVMITFVLGLCITIALQSSSATILCAMAFCAAGWISFPLAIGWMMGDNVGTTLTAVFAAKRTSVNGRRAAYAHLWFNILGLVWALPLVYPVDAWLTPGDMPPTGLAFACATYHTLFNLITAALLIGFIPRIERLLTHAFPVREEDDEEFHLHFIQGGLLSTAELSVEEARKESVTFGKRCQKMFGITEEFVHMPNTGDQHSHAFSRIEKYEKITDRIELEIVRYLNQLDRSSISERISERIRSLFKICDELESIGDSCYHIARAVVRKRDNKIEFTAGQNADIDRMIELTRRDISLMLQLMEKRDLTAADLQLAETYEAEVNDYRNELREQNIKRVQDGEYTYQSGAIYMDIVSECERLCDFVINIIQALDEQSTRHFPS